MAVPAALSVVRFSSSYQVARGTLLASVSSDSESFLEYHLLRGLRWGTLVWTPKGGAPCAVQEVGYSGPIFPDGRGDRSTYCVPMHRTTHILTQSKNSDNGLEQTMFHTKSTRLLSESAFFALWAYVFAVVG